MLPDRFLTSYSGPVERLLAALGVEGKYVTSVTITILPNELVTVLVSRLATADQIDALAAELEAQPMKPEF